MLSTMLVVLAVWTATAVVLGVLLGQHLRMIQLASEPVEVSERREPSA